jgi:hypothetical protein
MRSKKIADLDLNCIRVRNSLNLGKSDSKMLNHLSECAGCKSSEQLSKPLIIDQYMPPINLTGPDWDKFMVKLNSEPGVLLKTDKVTAKPAWTLPDLPMKTLALDFALLLLISFCIYFPADKGPDDAVYRQNEAMFISTSIKKFNAFREFMSSTGSENSNLTGGNQ